MLIPEKEIKLYDIDSPPVSLEVFPESKHGKDLRIINESVALENGEAVIQLFEGHSYEYKLSKGYQFEELPQIVKQSKRDCSGGRITPGIYVGTLTLKIQDSAREEKGSVSFEVRSFKSSYREDYRFMLENITEHCTDLIMQYSSPVTQSFTSDFDTDPETLYQRFAFVKSALDSDEFNDALHRILSVPVTAWSETDEETDIRRIKRLGSSPLRQIASRANRIRLPDGHALKLKMSTIPARISAGRKTETVDTPENRFVKHVLEVFRSFCAEIGSLLSKNNENMSRRAYKETLQLEEKLGGMLNHDLFREISPPLTLPLNSPVLQRKEGYREILRVWLMFDVAARLIWKGGDDVYNAGKRDVAVLYEYWLFFKLLEILKDIFVIVPDSLDNLIDKTADGLGLKLKSGTYVPLKGVFKNKVRDLNVEFSYNRTFKGEKDYPLGGSWSKSMRPDYTLSFWPADFSRDAAEEQELIVHIHFDAKYRIERLKDIIGEDDIDLDNEKEEERSGTYKRADLLKMHAYKDAIRRTGGAYVLYPGNENEVSKGFHEIIPGLGAFSVRPSRTNDGTGNLKVFINEIVKHLLNRASQHESITYRAYDIFKEKNTDEVREPIPEYHESTRALPPADTFVLVGYCKSEGHYNWIQKYGLYNFRITGRGALSKDVDPGMFFADYILIHKGGHLITGDIRKIKKIQNAGPAIYAKAEIQDLGYPDPTQEEYLVYQIEKKAVRGFKGAEWDIRELKGYKKGRASAIPFAVSLAELMKVKIAANEE